jgi:hypothetical protein
MLSLLFGDVGNWAPTFCFTIVVKQSFILVYMALGKIAVSTQLSGTASLLVAHAMLSSPQIW